MIPISDQPERRRRTVPVVVVSLIALNILILLLEISLGSQAEELVAAYGVVPYEITTGRDIYPQIPIPVYLTIFTSMFLHGGLLHIGANLLFLWIFGDNVEDALGHVGFIVFYLVTGVAASLTQVAISPLSRIPSIGASGAIAGVLAAYLLLFPHSQVRTLLIIFPFITITRLSAILLIGAWFIIQLFSGLVEIGVSTGQSSNVAFWAHIGGFVAGLAIVGLLKATGRY